MQRSTVASQGYRVGRGWEQASRQGWKGRARDAKAWRGEGLRRGRATAWSETRRCRFAPQQGGPVKRIDPLWPQVSRSEEGIRLRIQKSRASFDRRCGRPERRESEHCWTGALYAGWRKIETWIQAERSRQAGKQASKGGRLSLWLRHRKSRESKASRSGKWSGTDLTSCRSALLSDRSSGACPGTGWTSRVQAP